MIFGILMVVRRLLILLVLAIGWGYWIGRFTGRGKNDNGRVFVWLGVAGFCGWPLLLQSLVYLGLPLRFTAWPAFAIGVAGLVLAVIAGRRTLVEWLSRGRVYGLVFTTSFLAQASGLLSIGPMQYFGTGHVDHANYVVTAEFLRSEKFATRFEDLGHRPWLLKPLDTKEQRITQCVVLGALAEIDRSSAQECYGTVSAFFVALMALATTAWLRTGGLAAGLAGWAGLGAALTPAITRIQLDGFFSQTATLFVYPALAGLLTWSAPLTTATKVCAALLLAFMIGSYSEVAVLGVALVAALVLFRGPPVRSRVFEFAAIVAGALFLNAGYLGRLVNFLIGQALFASNPRVLAALFPESGTWIGWGRMFVDLRWPDLVVGTGAGVSFLAVRGVVATGPVQRRERLMVVGIALLPLLVLRLMPDFPRYPFGKLAAHFVPIWLGASMYGLTSFGKASVGFRRFAWCCGCFGAAASFVSAWPFQIEIVRPVGRLKALSSDALLQSRRDAEAHPERAYLVAHRDPLMALWLCYLGRANPIVLEVRTLGDRIVPSESSAFRHW
ncbi:MAG: hypothetical protein ABIY47_05665, partial [Opitutaceae bacterium]